MKKKLFILRQLCLVGLIFICGCSKDDDDDGGSIIGGTNKSPTCSITNPQANAQFSMDESISVTVVAEDTDGTISEVQLYIDDVGHSAKTTFPYNFTINAGELAAGSHTLKAVAKDDLGAKGETSVAIIIKQPGTESPDFVSFSDGKVPNTWQTTAWKIDNALGYDDIYSIKATAVDVALVTSKTCTSTVNFVEFYLYGSASFYINGTKVKNCMANDGWSKFGFYLEEGVNTLKWQSVSNLVNLDAIRFREETQLAVGRNYQGGIIAYLDNTNQHGLIAAPEDQSGTYTWSNALTVCNDLVFNGYSDWHLPSKDELNMLYQNRNLIGGFDTSSYYWSSSEYDNNYYGAWSQSFSGGSQNYGS